MRMLGDQPSLAQTRVSHRGDGDRRGVARADPALPPRRLAYLLGFLRLRRTDGLGVVAAVRPRPRAVPAVRVPARRGHRDRHRVPARGDPQSGARRRELSTPCSRCISAGIGAALAAMRQVWIQSLPKGSGAGVRDGPQLHDGDDAARRRHRAKVLTGSGECAEARLGVPRPAIPAWTLVFFIAMIVAAIALTRQD